jgi:hypothetical protein
VQKLVLTLVYDPDLVPLADLRLTIERGLTAFSAE